MEMTSVLQVFGHKVNLWTTYSAGSADVDLDDGTRWKSKVLLQFNLNGIHIHAMKSLLRYISVDESAGLTDRLTFLNCLKPYHSKAKNIIKNEKHLQTWHLLQSMTWSIVLSPTKPEDMSEEGQRSFAAESIMQEVFWKWHRRAMRPYKL